MFVLLSADEVHGEMADDGHVLRPVTGPEPDEIVVKYDVERPMQPVLDVPVGSNCIGEGLGIKLG